MNPSIYVSSNPITGVFGIGRVQFFPGGLTTQTYTFTIPSSAGQLRVRCWGGGGYLGGGGGGFAMRTFPVPVGITSVIITVGLGGNSASTTGGTSSFGSFVSATGGVASGAGGSGVGGDFNYSGGAGSGTSGGGCAGLFGNGGNSALTVPGCAGGGASTARSGGHGFMGLGGIYQTNGTYVVPSFSPTSGLENGFSLDFIGTGGGAGASGSGINGSGGGGSALANTANNGGFPGGGMGAQATVTSGYGGPGLVIVEW